MMIVIQLFGLLHPRLKKSYYLFVIEWKPTCVYWNAFVPALTTNTKQHTPKIDMISIHRLEESEGSDFYLKKNPFSLCGLNSWLLPFLLSNSKINTALTIQQNGKVIYWFLVSLLLRRCHCPCGTWNLCRRQAWSMTFLLFCAMQVFDLASSYEQLHNNIEFDSITSLVLRNLCCPMFWGIQINLE